MEREREKTRLTFAEILALIACVVIFIICLSATLVLDNPAPVTVGIISIALAAISAFGSWITTRYYERKNVEGKIRENNIQIGNSTSTSIDQLDRIRAQQAAAGMDETPLMLLRLQLENTLQMVGGTMGDSDRQEAVLLNSI
jgi:hypothetical protein